METRGSPLDADFVHLHAHSRYSILDGMSRPADMVARAQALGQPAIAVTDHGGLYGVIEFAAAAKAVGIRSLLGCEVYVAPRLRSQRQTGLDGANYHLTLLAADETGWRNLIRLVSLAHLDGFYYKPRVDLPLLAQYAKGLICLSGCLAGEVPQKLLNGDASGAMAAAAAYRDIFKGDYFIEVMDQGLADQVGVTRGLVALARDLDVPLVATNDSHYVHQRDHRAHGALLAIQTNDRLDGTGDTQESKTRKSLRLETDQFYLKSAAEMARALPGLPDALRNTRAVAERCTLTLAFDRVALPQMTIPGGQTEAAYLRQQVAQGLKWRYGTPTQEHLDRTEYELGVIERTGYPGYFLFVQEYVTWARQQGILAIPRGSVAGSLCVYALGICDLDPLQYGLMFERFLHEERIGMPDIDMDFEDDRRAEVLAHIAQRYGRDRVAQISTFGTMAARASVRDVGRVLGRTFQECDRLAKLIPVKDPDSREAVTIPDALRMVPDLQRAYDTEDGVKELLDLASALEGTPRSISTHAAGVVVADRPLHERVPVQHPSRSESEIVTQWAHQQVEEAGLLKADLLGVANLSTIKRTVASVKARHGRDLEIFALPQEPGHPEADATWEMLGQGHTEALFQLESGGMRNVLRLLQPSSIQHLVAVVALYRPGPMDMIPAYLGAKNGTQEIAFLHADLEPVLAETYGVLTYQDQVLQAVRVMAGYSWGEADVLRKAMGKKLPALMRQQRQFFLDKMVANGHSKDLAARLWGLIAPFAGYGFPKGHAAAYAVIAYVTAYLKANFPQEYLCEVLTAEAGKIAKTAAAVGECRRLGIAVLPPHVNHSGSGYTLDNGTNANAPAIRFGLDAIKGCGHDSVAAIVAEREKSGPFPSVYDLCLRVPKARNRRILEPLIKAGALAGLGETAALLEHLTAILTNTAKVSKRLERGQLSLFDGTPTSAAQEVPLAVVPDIDAPAGEATLAAWEREALGFYLERHPLRDLADHVPAYATALSACTADLAGDSVTVAGFVADRKIIFTRKEQHMAILTLEDQSGSVEVVVFPRLYEEVRELLTEDATLLITGLVEVRDEKPQVLADSVVDLRPAGAAERVPVPAAAWDDAPPF